MAYLFYDLDNKSRDVRHLENEMHYSRSTFVTWGKEVVFAIDQDHAGRLITTFKTKAHLGADLNAQVTKLGYGGYAWTLHMHNFLGKNLSSLTPSLPLLRVRVMKCVVWVQATRRCIWRCGRRRSSARTRCSSSERGRTSATRRVSRRKRSFRKSLEKR